MCRTVLLALLLLPSCLLAQSLNSDVLTVELDPDRPRIARIVHKPSGQTLTGPGALGKPWRVQTSAGWRKLSDEDIRRTATDDEVRYRISAGAGTAFDVVASLDGDELTLAVGNVRGDLRAVDFGREPLVTVPAEANWTVAHARMMDGGTLTAADQAPDGRETDWAVLSNGRLAVAVQNTIIRRPNVLRRAKARVGLAPNVWHYALKDGHTSPLYRAVIGVTGDRNGDGLADWQDGCLILQRHVPGELPEMIHRMILGWVGIEPAAYQPGMNATFPQIGNIIRRTYNITAGEPTAMGLAGWCYWGWDSEYPACDEASRRAGGNAALVAACQEAWRYGGQISLCINFDDAYKHSPAWDIDMMCTHAGGRPHVYMYWNGGLAYHICPYKDVRQGSAFERIETMLDFGTAGSCYIDVLSAAGAMDKHSEGPGGHIDWRDNLIAGKFPIADYYWNHGVKLYSEHMTYPFVGRILGGLNNWDTGLHGDKPDRVPMPLFILHGKMNNFATSTRYGRAGRTLLGIIPAVDGHVGSPDAQHLDEIFLHSLVSRTFIDHPMRRFALQDGRFRVEYTDDTYTEMDADGGNLRVVVDGRKIADDHSAFIPRARGGYWAYSDIAQTVTYPLPAGWEAEDIRVFALHREGRHEPVRGAHEVRGDRLMLHLFARVPYLLLHGQDLVPVGSADYGRHARTIAPADDAAPAAGASIDDGDVVLASGRRVALPDAGPGHYVAAVETDQGVWVAQRTATDSAPYGDKRLRKKDRLLLIGPGGRTLREAEIIGPVTGLDYDPKRNHLLASAASVNYDNLQFVDAASGRVVGLLPLVREQWGDMRVCVAGDLAYVSSTDTDNVAAVRLDVPWPQAAADWVGRIFDEPTDPRDPEAALDAFRRVRWDRLRAIHQLGAEPLAMTPRDGAGLTVRVRAGTEPADPQWDVTIAPVAGPWKPEAKNGEFPAPFPRLARALALPREKIVATNQPGNRPVWWLDQPEEKHRTGLEPTPADSQRMYCVSPRYPTVAEAKRHAALIAAIRTRNWVRSRTTGPLAQLGERRGVNRSHLRSGRDFWMVGYCYVRDNVFPETIMNLETNDWYVETIEMPDGRTLYRAGLQVDVPVALVQRIWDKALAGEAKWYRNAAATADDPARKKEWTEFAELFEDAATEVSIDWIE